MEPMDTRKMPVGTELEFPAKPREPRVNAKRSLSVQLHPVVIEQLKAKCAEAGISAAEYISWVVMEFMVRRKERPLAGDAVFEACRKMDGRGRPPGKAEDRPAVLVDDPVPVRWVKNSRGRWIRRRKGKGGGANVPMVGQGEYPMNVAQMNGL